MHIATRTDFASCLPCLLRRFAAVAGLLTVLSCGENSDRGLTSTLILDDQGARWSCDPGALNNFPALYMAGKKVEYSAMAFVGNRTLGSLWDSIYAPYRAQGMPESPATLGRKT